MSINPSDITCIIPTHNSAPMLEICLKTLAYYAPELTKVMVVDRDSTDNTKEIVCETGFQYTNLPYIPERADALEHSDSIEHGYKNCDTDWILFIHNDVEFCKFGIWNALEEVGESDITYGFIREKALIITMPDGFKLYSAPQTSFLLVKKSLLDEAYKAGLSIACRFDNAYYDVFYDIWQWAKANNKKVHRMFTTDFYIHYWSYTMQRLRIDKQPDNVKLFCTIIDGLLKLKLEYLKTNKLPFPEKMQASLIKSLAFYLHD